MARCADLHRPQERAGSADGGARGPSGLCGAAPGAIKLGGPFLDEAGRMAGSLIILEAEDMTVAEAFSAADPYRLAGLFETVDIRPWRVTVGGFAG